jgi:ABC-type transport system involved in multi-copper enzyme maturation permease subunit
VPWVLAWDRQTILAQLRRGSFWGWLLGGLAAAALAVTLFVQTNNDRTELTRWGRGYAAVLHLQLLADLFVGAFAAMLLLWPKGGAVGLAAFREGLRQPMFWMLFFLSFLFLMPLVPVLPYFTLGEDFKMVKELEYDLIMLFALIFGVIMASMSISEEIEGRTAVTLMSKPISRRQFLLGKFAGIFLASLVMMTLLGWWMVWMFIFKQWWDPPLGQVGPPPDPEWVTTAVTTWAPQGEPMFLFRGFLLWVDEAGAALPGIVIVSCQVMVLLAIATALATRLSMVVNLPICIAIYFLGHLSPILIASERARPPEQRYRLVEFMAQVFNTVLPGLEHFQLSAAIVRDAPLRLDDFALYAANVGMYAVMYSAIALLFGLILFEDRDLA